MTVWEDGAEGEANRVLAGLMRRILRDEGDEIGYIALGEKLAIDGQWTLTSLERFVVEAVLAETGCVVLDCPNRVAGWDDAAIQDDHGDFHDGRVPLCQEHADEMGRVLRSTEMG